MLLSWPLVAIWLFQRFPKPQAGVLAVIVPYMLLPEATGFDLPLVPAIEKTSLGNFMAVLLVATTAGAPLRLAPRGPVLALLFACLAVGTVMTSITNSDWLFIGPTVLQGLGLYDAGSSLMRTALVIAPFLVGRSLLGSVEGHRLILQTLLVAGLVYSLPMMFEVRMSPQLHTWIYGFFPHAFDQQMRGDGFRPVVFMQHGLWVAFFAMSATVSAAILWRAETGGRRGLLLLALGWLFVVLVFCKSLGSLAFALFLVPVVMLLGRRLQIAIAAALVSVALLYPALRGAHLIPVRSILDLAESISAERAQSLAFRIENEEMLLERAGERPLFGWGGYGRNEVYDPVTGRDLTVTDGYWIIVVGQSGWVGYIAIFGLLAWPVLAVRFAARGPPPLETAGLCLLLAINMVELLPNASLMPYTWLIAGALFGYVENGAPAAARDPAGAAAVPERPRIRTVL